MKGLVRKSKRFLHMNLSNPKGVSFGTEEGTYLLFGHVETNCVGGGRLKATCLKEKLMGGFLEILLWAYSIHPIELGF